MRDIQRILINEKQIITIKNEKDSIRFRCHVNIGSMWKQTSQTRLSYAERKQPLC
jgi:hypothetical protein